MHSYSTDVALDYDSFLRAASVSLELGPISLDSSEPPHAEDAFLAEHRAWLMSSGMAGAELSVAADLGHDALDLVDGPEGPWQALAVEAWLSQGAVYAVRHGLSATQLRQLAREFLAWLGHHARLSLHGQRLLQRRIAAARIELASHGVAPVPPLAA